MTCEEYARYRHNKQQLAYYYANHEENKAKRAAYAREWRKKKTEAAAATRKAYHDRHRDEIRQRRKDYYQKNRERILEQRRLKKQNEKIDCNGAADAGTGYPGSGRP